MKNSFWIIGTLLALTGVVIARIIAPDLAKEMRLTTNIIAYNISLIGLIIIIFGISKKARQREKSEIENNKKGA